MKQAHDEILKNWNERAKKLRLIWWDNETGKERRKKAFALWLTLTLQMRIVIEDKIKSERAKIPKGGIMNGNVFSGNTGEPHEFIAPLSKIEELLKLTQQ